MSEFTLRKKTSNRPIMSLRPKVLERMLAARPESTALVLAKQNRVYKNLTGKDLSFDYEQEALVLQRAGANSQGMWTSPYSLLPHPWGAVERAFQDGFMARTPSGSLLEDLDQVEAFYSLLDAPLELLNASTAANAKPT